MIGRVLDGRYEILEEIDSGGMAYIYKARCKKHDQIVAVKAVKPEYCSDMEYIERFKNEAQAALTLNHKNIVKVTDVGCDQGRYYLVMEYVEGDNLKQLIKKRGPLEISYATQVAIEICAALEHAHRHGFIHRDIKPQNILVSKTGEIRITDFGIAEDMFSEAAKKKEAVLGSVHYFSPEQAKGEEMDVRTDVYSLGIVLYEMLTGKLPFEGNSTVSVARKHINEEIKPPRKVNPKIPESLNAIVIKATGKDKNQRYPSAREFKEDLIRSIVDPAGDFIKSAEAAHQKMNEGHQRRHKRSILWLAGTVVFTVILVLVFIFVSRGEVGPETEATVPVPDLGLKTEEEAAEILSQAGLTMEVLYENSEDVMQGLIMSQDPDTGTDVQEGSTVTVTVSNGPVMVEVPPFIDQQYESAVALLEELGLEEGEVTYEVSDQPEGYILAQEPEPGAFVLPGEIVNFTVSNASDNNMLIMPSLVGTEVSKAVQMLYDTGFSKCFVYEEEADAQEWTVINQQPAEGIREEPGTAVSLWISENAEKPYYAEAWIDLPVDEQQYSLKVTQEEYIDGILVEIVIYEASDLEGDVHLELDLNSTTAVDNTIRVYINNTESYSTVVAFS